MRPSVNTLNVSPAVGCGSGINTESEAGISLGYLGSGTARGEGEWVEVGMKMKKKETKKKGKKRKTDTRKDLAGVDSVCLRFVYVGYLMCPLRTVCLSLRAHACEHVCITSLCRRCHLLNVRRCDTLM